MSANDFFSPYAQEDVRIREFPAKSPLFYRDLGMMAGVFSADLAVVRSMLPDSRLRPIRIGRRRALVALHCFEYRDSDIGPYNEISLSIGLALGSRWRPSALAAFESLRSGHFHGFVRQLPVTTKVAVYGGIDFFNYPKYLATISFRDEGKTRSCSLVDRETGEEILSVQGRAVARRKLPSPKVLTMHTYPEMDGETREARVKLKLQGASESYLLDDISVTPGKHPRADDFRRLRLGRPLHYIVAPRCEAILFAPKVP